MPKTKVRLYLNADRTMLVPEGSSEAAWLLASAGKEISPDDMDKYDISKAHLDGTAFAVAVVPDAEPAEGDEEGEKARGKAPANKARTSPDSVK